MGSQEEDGQTESEVEEDDPVTVAGEKQPQDDEGGEAREHRSGRERAFEEEAEEECDRRRGPLIGVDE